MCETLTCFLLHAPHNPITPRTTLEYTEHSIEYAQGSSQQQARGEHMSSQERCARALMWPGNKHRKPAGARAHMLLHLVLRLEQRMRHWATHVIPNPDTILPAPLTRADKLAEQKQNERDLREASKSKKQEAKAAKHEVCGWAFRRSSCKARIRIRGPC